MKKLFAVLLAVVMLATAAQAVFATDTADAGEITGNNGTKAPTIDVEGTYIPGKAADEQISVDISWTSLRFTYTAGDERYDTQTHKTTSGDGSWSTDKATITVTNHSNTVIDASFAFSPSDNSVNGSFTKDKITVESADDEQYQTPGADGKYPAPSQSTQFGINANSAPILEEQKLGTITVQLKKADYAYNDETQTYTVYTFAGLKTVLSAGGNIKLGADIEASENPTVSGKTVTLDLNGHSLWRKGNDTYFAVNEDNSSLTVKDSVGTGKLSTESYWGIRVSDKASLTVESGRIETTGGSVIDISGGSKVTVNGGTLVSLGENKDGINISDTTSGNELKIAGGTVTAKNNAVVLAGPCVAEISGGNITGNITWNTATANTGTLTVTGGSFSIDPSDYVDSTAYQVTNNDTTFIVTAK